MADDTVVEAAELGSAMRQIRTLLPAQLSERTVYLPFHSPVSLRRLSFYKGKGKELLWLKLGEAQEMARL